MKKKITYPTRCLIVDVDGMPAPGLPTLTERWPGLTLRTPEASRPHVGKEGLAELESDSVRITLDDGTVLHGWECWWVPLEKQQ